MTDDMRAITQDVFGGPEVLFETRLPIPEPGIGEVLIRVHAAGVNPVDMMNRRTGVFAGRTPLILGWDVAGVVAKVGPGVTLFHPGDEVFGLLPFPHGAGAYAEFVVAPTRTMVAKPAGLTFVEAAAIPLAGLTAWQALVETARIGEGTRLLVTGATGGVGHMALQIAKARGAHVTAVASAGAEELARSLGADAFVDYRSVDVDAQVGDLDVYFDVIGGDYPVRALNSVRPGGMLVSTLPQSLAAAREQAVGRGVRVEGLFVEADRLGLGGIVELVERDRFRPVVAATYPLADVARAHAEKSGPGKVVLVVE